MSLRHHGARLAALADVLPSVVTSLAFPPSAHLVRDIGSPSFGAVLAAKDWLDQGRWRGAALSLPDFGLRIQDRVLVLQGRSIVRAAMWRPGDGSATATYFYRSTGLCTPEISPAGTWWPCHGFVRPSPSGGLWIVKSLWSLTRRQEVPHRKTPEELAAHGLPHAAISAFLESLCEGRKAA